MGSLAKHGYPSGGIDSGNPKYFATFDTSHLTRHVTRSRQLELDLRRDRVVACSQLLAFRPNAIPMGGTTMGNGAVLAAP